MSEENNLPKTPEAQAPQSTQEKAPAEQTAKPAPASVPADKKAEQPVQAAAPAASEKPAEKQAEKPAAKEGGDVARTGRRRGRAVVTAKPQESKPVLKEETVLKIKGVFHSKLFILGVVLIVLGGGCFGVVSSIPSVLEKRLPSYMTKHGLPLKSLKVKSFGFSEAELSNLVFSIGGMKINSVKISYFLPDLWIEKTLKSMDVSGLILNGNISEEGVSFGGLENVLHSQGSEGFFSVDSLKMSTGRLVITKVNQEEPFTVNFTANGSVKKDSLTIKSDLSFQNDNYSVKAILSLLKSKTQTTLTSEIVEGNVLEGEQTVGGVTGTMDLAIENGVLTEVKADLSLETPKQNMKLAGAVIPKGESFAFDASFSRKFKDGVDPQDNFIGDLSLKSDNIIFKGDAKNATIDLPLTLQVVSAANKQVQLERMNVSLDGVLSCVDSVCSYKMKKEAPLKLDVMQYSGAFSQVKIAEPLQVSLFTTENLFVYQNGMLAFSPALLPFTVKAFVITPESSSQFAAAMKENSLLKLSYNVFSGAYNGTFSFSSAEILTKDYKTPQATGIVGFNKSSLTEAKILAKNVSLVQEKILAPFDIQATVSPLSPNEYGINAVVAMKNNLVTARAEGSYDFASKTWSLLLKMPKTAFSPSGLSFAELFPVVTEKMQAPLTGTLALDGRMTIAGDKKVTGQMKVLLSDVSTRIGTFDIKNLTTVLNVSSLNPFETSESQSVYIGQLNMGIPFNGVSANFRARKDGITVSALSMNYADANFRLMKQLFIPYDGVPNTFLLEGQGVSFSQLSSLLRVPGLEVDGTGALLLKLSLDKGNVMVEEGKMTLSRSSGGIGGMFRYDPPSSQKVNLDPRLKEFLKSVVFNDMTLTMRGMLAGKMSFKFDMNGYASADETQHNRKVSLNMENSLLKLLKPEEKSVELPPTIINLVQENFK